MLIKLQNNNISFLFSYSVFFYLLLLTVLHWPTNDKLIVPLNLVRVCRCTCVLRCIHCIIIIPPSKVALDIEIGHRVTTTGDTNPAKVVQGYTLHNPTFWIWSWLKCVRRKLIIPCSSNENDNRKKCFTIPRRYLGDIVRRKTDNIIAKRKKDKKTSNNQQHTTHKKHRVPQSLFWWANCARLFAIGVPLQCHNYCYEYTWVTVNLK